MDVTITYLQRRGGEVCEALSLPSGFHITDESGAGGGLYRTLYYEVGERYFWWERRKWNDRQWLELSDNPHVALWVLREGDTPCGFFELDFADIPAAADLSFFGLYDNYIGRGLGKVLLSHAVSKLQEKSPEVLRVNTCDLDHGSAIKLYKNFGFIEQHIEKKEVTDPRIAGLLPQNLPLPSHYQGRA